MKYEIRFILIILVILIALNIYYYFTLSFNLERHLTDSYSYAHFSNINLYNYFLNPSFNFQTHLTYVELKEGESLYIPSKMWHWIITDTKSFSISFWFDKEKNNKINHRKYKIDPVLTNDESNEIYEIFEKELKNTSKINIWNTDKMYSSEEMNGNYYFNLDKKNKNFITLDGYNYDYNYKIKNKIIKNIKIPEIIQKVQIPDSYYECNLWYTSGSNDTGLHYDDYDSVIHLIKGKKRIYLYPSEDSKYISSYSIIPNYALTKPIFMNYNEYFIYNDLNIPGKSSQYLLYKTLFFFSKNKNINKIIQKVYELTRDKKKLIWGFKKIDDVYRWEIYIYHYELSQYNLQSKKFIYLNYDIQNTNPNINIRNELLNQNIIINSFDIFNTNKPLNGNLHTYEKKYKNNKTIPIYGIGYDIINNKNNKNKVGEFIYDLQENFIKNSKKFLSELNLPYNEKIHYLLYKYKCKNLCVWNKENNLFIQWLVISVDDFLYFLEENKYQEDFINYIKNNLEDYRNISHEITIVYHPITLEKIRSGFYGCL